MSVPLIQTSGSYAQLLPTDPSKYTWAFDDFVMALSTAVSTGTVLSTAGNGGQGINWGANFSGAGAAVTRLSPIDSGTYGVVKCTCGSTSTNTCAIQECSGSGNTANPIAYNSTLFDMKVRVALGATTNLSAFFGMNKQEAFGEASTDYIGIAFDTNQSDTGWMAVAKTAGTATRTAITGSTLDTSYHTLRIRCLVAGTILFSIDGGAEISISSNVSSTALSVQLDVTTRTSSSQFFKADYFWRWIAISR